MWNIPASDSALNTRSGSWRICSISSDASATSGFSAWARSIGPVVSPRGCCITLSLVRPIAADLHTPHQAAIGTGIVHRDVLDATVVPERHGARLPAKPASELGPMAVLEQVIEQRLALGLGHVLEADGIGRIDEQELALGLGMGAHDRMDADGLAPGVVLAHLGRALGVHAGLRARDLAVGVHRPHGPEHRLHAVAERVIGGVLACEHGVAAIGRD